MKTKLTDKLIAEIKEARELKMSCEEIEQMFNISKSTVYRALKKIKEEEEARSENEDADTTMASTILTVSETVVAENVNVGSTVEDFDTDLNMYPIGNGSHVKCGLVKERHEMPCQLYVFDEALTEQLMFDYKAQLEICEAFITEHVEFKNGKPCQDVVCYVTGIQCALAAFIRACHDNGVNLILRHYNNRYTKYAYQSIWSEFGETYPDYMASLIGQSDKVCTYNVRLSEMKTQHLYTVCVVTYTKDNAPITSLYLCASLADAYRVNYTLVEILMYKRIGRYQVYLEERQLNSKESGYMTYKILKTCNETNKGIGDSNENHW